MPLAVEQYYKNIKCLFIMYKIIFKYKINEENIFLQNYKNK